MAQPIRKNGAYANVCYGVAGGYAARAAGIQVANGVSQWLAHRGIEPKQPQDFARLLRKAGRMGPVFKIALIAYAVFGGPAIEEALFRKHFYRLLETDSLPKAGQIAALFTNALFFAAAHLSPYQGWSNLPIFAFTFTIGLAFTLLRFQTGDTYACTIAHSTANALALRAFLMSG